MHNHAVTTIRVGNAWRGGCTCRTRGPIVTQQWEAEDWGRVHLADIDRIRSRLYTSTPTLEQTMRWYRQAALDDNIPAESRAIFDQMADEIEHRLAGSPAEQLPLFTEPERKPHD